MTKVPSSRKMSLTSYEYTRMVLYARFVTSTCITAKRREDDPWIWAREHAKKLKSLLVPLGTNQSPTSGFTFPPSTSSM